MEEVPYNNVLGRGFSGLGKGVGFSIPTYVSLLLSYADFLWEGANMANISMWKMLRNPLGGGVPTSQGEAP